MEELKTNNMKVELIEELTDKEYQKQIWEMLCVYDKTFTPPLSRRDSVISYEIIPEDDGEDWDRKPLVFYKDLKSFSFIIYSIDNDIKSFLAFKKDYKLGSLNDVLPTASKTIYVAFTLVRKDYRSHGLFFVMNTILEGHYRKKYDYVTRRVSSLNMAMINSLTSKNDYTIGNVGENERGNGVHTLSLYKKLK